MWSANAKNIGYVLPVAALLIFFQWDSRARAQQTSTAILTNGNRIEASQLTVDRNQTVVLETQDGRKAFQVTELVQWGRFLEVPRGVAAMIGSHQQQSPTASVLKGELIGIDEANINISSEIFSSIALSRHNVLGVIWKWSANIEERDRLWKELASEKRTRDVMWMTNGDQLTGRLAPSSSPGGLAAIRIIPRIDSPPLTASIDNVVAVGLETESAETAFRSQPHAAIGMRDGSLLWAASISSGESQTEIKLIDGPTLVAPNDLFWSSVSGIQWFSSNVTYLSDLETAGFKHIPFLSAEWKYGTDRNDSGGRLRSGRAVYLKGIGMHTTSRLAYDVDRKYRRFYADIALDDLAGRQGSVLFRVFVERSEGNRSAGDNPPTKEPATHWQVAYTSPVVRGGDLPIPVSVDISGADRIALVVDFADFGDEQDHANWLNARLMR